MIARLVAFSLLACAAFAWVPPFIDRVGLAALGFAFLALAVGRAPGVARPSLLERTGLLADAPGESPDEILAYLQNAGFVPPPQP